jgi:hypothetical protein
MFVAPNALAVHVSRYAPLFTGRTVTPFLYIWLLIDCNSLMSYANTGKSTAVTSVRGRLQPLREEGGRRQADEGYSNDVEILGRAKTRK